MGRGSVKWRSISSDSATWDFLAKVGRDRGPGVGQGDVADVGGGEWGSLVTSITGTLGLIPG